MKPAYKIVYVLSMTHSGSTLLDSLIGAHSQAIGIGEVFQLKSYADATRVKSQTRKLGNQCTCGADTIWECPFWTEVNRSVQEYSQMTLCDLSINSTDRDRFTRDNRIFFDAVASVSGARLIVDSSKSHKRFQKLKDSGFADVTPIFLLRDPRGQVYSIVKRRHSGVFLPALRYSKNTVQSIIKLWSQNPIAVSYSDLSTQPDATLSRVMLQLGLQFEPGQLDWAPVVRHNLSGNAMRATKDSRIGPDESWRNGLSRRQCHIIRLLTGPARYLAMRKWRF